MKNMQSTKRIKNIIFLILSFLIISVFSSAENLQQICLLARQSSNLIKEDNSQQKNNNFQQAELNKVNFVQNEQKNLLQKQNLILLNQHQKLQQNVQIQTDQIQENHSQGQEQQDQYIHFEGQAQAQDSHGSHYHTPSDSQFWWNTLLALVLTCIGAFCSGIGVGFCNIDKLQLQVMCMSRNPNERHFAKTIQDCVSKHHLWLVTILVYNAIALQSLPLVVHTLMPDWAAILFSTIIVLIAAQIIPQAVCTGPKKMQIAYYAAPIIGVMRKLLFFIIHPIAHGLDKLLGVHGHQRIQHKDLSTFLTGNKLLKNTQKMLLTSTLQLRCQRVLQKMIPLKKLLMFECNQLLTKQKVEQMLKSDYSHVLVYRQTKQTIVGVIKVKQFAVKYLRGKNQQFKAQQVMDNQNPFLSVYMDTNLLQMLMLFQSNSHRIALICDQKKKTNTGIPSIMYTKNDMIMKTKGANIVGAIFLYQIFDELTNIQQTSLPKQRKLNEGGEMRQMRQMKQLKQPLIGKH